MIFYCALSIGRVFSATIKTCPNVHQVHNVVLTIEMSINMQNNEQTEYKTVRGLTRGLMLLNMLNKLDGGASVGLLAELSGLHRTTDCWRRYWKRDMSGAVPPMTVFV